MKTDLLISILRNPYGFSTDKIREARLEAANRIEEGTRPDQYCVTDGSGKCISNHPLCMHQLKREPTFSDRPPAPVPPIEVMPYSNNGLP